MNVQIKKITRGGSLASLEQVFSQPLWGFFLFYILSRHNLMSTLCFPSCISNDSHNFKQLGIYPIVNRADELTLLLESGITTVQVRIKDLDSGALRAELTKADSIAKKFSARLFINDYWKIAIELNAYGVHLGQEDLEDANLVAIHQAGLRLGVSTHNPDEITKVAQNLGINPSYIAIGAIFATESKKIATPTIGLKNLKKWTESINLPVVAIGGINYLNIQQVIDCGVSGIAMIQGIKVENLTQSESIRLLQQKFINVSRET